MIPTGAGYFLRVRSLKAILFMKENWDTIWNGNQGGLEHGVRGHCGHLYLEVGVALSGWGTCPNPTTVCAPIFWTAIWNAVKATWETVTSAIKAIYDNILAPIFGSDGFFVQGVKAVVEPIGTAIGQVVDIINSSVTHIRQHN